MSEKPTFFTEKTDTIAAMATAPGEAGVAIVRISGPAAFRIADRIFRCAGRPPSERPSHRVVFGRVVSPRGEILDEALLLPMRAPHSYTGEDVVEIHGHGGASAPRAILTAACEAGARVAAPGEFTRRAFENGKLDLTQAEAVLDLVRARSDRAARVAVRQLEGELGRKADEIYELCLRSATVLEAGIEFTEFIDNELDTSIIASEIKMAREKIAMLLQKERQGALIREGVRVVIAGGVNAGKSTLFNALLGRDRAIVSAIPGTTRDVIEDGIQLEGIAVRLYDTAGIRETQCEIESEGISRAISNVINSDITVYVIDSTLGITPADRRFLVEMNRSKTILVANKSDVRPDADFEGLLVPPLRISALKTQGLEELKKEIVEKAFGANDSEEALISERHAELLRMAVQSLERAEYLVDLGESYLLPAVSAIRQAAEKLGEITGRVCYPDLLDSIFSRFCVGK